MRINIIGSGGIGVMGMSEALKRVQAMCERQRVEREAMERRHGGEYLDMLRALLEVSWESDGYWENDGVIYQDEIYQIISITNGKNVEIERLRDKQVKYIFMGDLVKRGVKLRDDDGDWEDE